MTSFFFSPHKNLTQQTMALMDGHLAPKHDILSAGTEVTQLDVGVIKFEPNTACDTSLVISCGVHGNETAPIEVVSKIIDELLEEDQKCGQRVLFILGNPWAMSAAERFIDVNMNRLFCGDWQHNDLSLKEVKRAAKLEAYVANFFAEEPVTATQRLHYDCHTAIRDSARARFAVYPFVEGRQLPVNQEHFLAEADIETVLLQQQPANTFASFTSAKQNAESFTLELGQVRAFGENELKQFIGIDNALRMLIAGDQLSSENSSAKQSKKIDHFEVCHDIDKTSEQWQFFVDDTAPNFTEFEPNTLIWQDGPKEYRVGDQPEYIVFPNPNVAVGQRAGLMLKKL